MKYPSRRAYHTIYETSLLEAIEYAEKSGWTGIAPDLSVPVFSPERISQKERDQLRQRAYELGIEWAIHAPGDDISLTAGYPPVQEAIVNYHKQVIDFARDVSKSATNVVVHAGTPPSFKKAGENIDAFSENYSKFYSNILLENLTELIEHGKSHVNIAIENQAWTSLVRDVVEQLIPKGLKLCLDIPKLYDISHGLKKEDWELFQKYKDSIEVVHVHDWNTRHRGHQIVGYGSTDFEPSLRLLDEISRPVQYVFEVRPREAAEKSLSNFVRILESLDLILP